MRLKNTSLPKNRAASGTSNSEETLKTAASAPVSSASPTAASQKLSSAEDFVAPPNTEPQALSGITSKVGEPASTKTPGVLLRAQNLTGTALAPPVQAEATGLRGLLQSIIRRADAGAADPRGYMAAEANEHGDIARNAIAHELNIDTRVAELDSVGDAFTLALGVEAAAGMSAGAAAELEIKKIKTGYAVVIEGEATAGIFGALGAGAGLFEAGIEGEAALTGVVKVKAKMANLEQAQQVARALAGIGIGTAVGGPVGLAVTAGSAREELAPFHAATTKTLMGVELSGAASTKLGASLGHVDAGGKAEVTATTGLYIAVTPNEPLAVVVESELEGETKFALGEGRISLPGDIGLEMGTVGAVGTVTLSTEIPLKTDNLSKVLLNPIDTVGHLAKRMKKGVTSLEAEVELAGAAGPILEVDHVAAEAQKGAALIATLVTEIENKAVRKTVKKALRGDLRGALAYMDKKAEVTLDVQSMKTAGIALNPEIKAGIFKIGVELEYLSEDFSPLYDFEGSVSELVHAAKSFGQRES